MPQEQPFGRQVRERRRGLDLTQEELARRVGCAAVTIRKIEAGDMRASQQIAERLAVALAIVPDERGTFIRQARSVAPESRASSPSPRTSLLAPGEIGATDLSGRAIRGYELGERIGAGGFGAVYRAVQPLVAREVAIKIILPQYADHPDFVRRFEAEAQLVARLEHPHIVPLYDYWREPGVAYLVMRLLRGGSFQALLEQGPPPLAHTLRLVEQIGAALHIAHRAGVVHRDLKPANLLLDEDQNAYVADFGIAKDITRPPGELSFAGAFIGSPAYSSPEQIRAEPVSPQTDIYALGVLLYELLTGRRPFDGPTPVAYIQQHLHAAVPPVAERRSGLPSALDRIMQRATAKVPSARYPDVRELVAELQEAIGEPKLRSLAAPPTPLVAAAPTVVLDLTDADTPFKGLRPFGEADTADFFGREALIQQLLTRMGESSELCRFLAVIGPSGSGKSSVVRAGLVPALRAGALQGSEQWYVIDLLPGAQPLRELAAALRRVAPAGVETEDLYTLLRADNRGLLRVTRLILPPEESELVLVIDQFEELFTLAEGEAERSHLLDSIVTAMLDERSRLRVVITLRADFIDRPLQYVDFGELLRQRAELVLPLTPEEVERAVTGPARRAGLVLEEGLAASIIADVGGQPGVLPLLQHALNELFARREGRALTLSAYRAIGGVAGALSRSAETLIGGLTAPDLDVARQVFLRLVTPGEGGNDTRRRARRSELDAAGPPAAVAQVIDAFGDARLLTFDHDPTTREPTVEVAHEALLYEWPRLRGWVAAARFDLYVQRRLALAAAEWEGSGYDASYLAVGARLGQFAALARAGALRLSEHEQAYLDASLSARAAQEQAERERAGRELQQARALAEEQRARAEAAQQVVTAERSAAGRLRALVAGLVLFLVIAIGLSMFALRQREQASFSAADARASFVRAEAQRLAAEANVVAQAGGSTELVALLALRSLQLQYTPQGDAALSIAASFELPGQAYAGHSDWVEDIAFAPDGKQFVTASQDKSARLWDLASGQELRAFSGHTGAIHGVAFAPDGRTILTGSQDTTVRLWDVGSGQELTSFKGPEKAVWGVAFSPDGTRILAGSYDGRAYLWDVGTGAQVGVLVHPREVYGVAFSPDSTKVVTGSQDGIVRIWDVASGDLLRELRGHAEQVRAVAFAPDGTTVLSGSHDKTARLWSVEDGEERARLSGHREFIWDVLYSPDGATIYTVSQDKSVRQWDTVSGLELRQLNGHSNYVLSAALSPDGAHLATGGREGVVRMWPAQPDAILPRFLGHTSDLHWAVFSPDGAYVLSGSLDNTARLWDATTGRLVRRFEGHSNDIHNVAFSPDGRLIGTASFDGTAAIWDAASGDRLFELPSEGATVYTVVFSPDGRLVATSGDDSDPTVRLWDVATGAQMNVMVGHSGGIHALAFSPDGRQLLSGSYDQTAKLWNVGSGTLTQSFAIPDGAVSLAFAPNGKTFVTGSNDKTARIWDVATGVEVLQLVGHTDTIKGAVFTPDGRYVVTGGSDGTARLWDATTGQELRRFSGHTGIINSVAVSADSQFICTASGDRTARLWALDYQKTVESICSRLQRDFTPEERAQFGITHSSPTCPGLSTS